MLGDRVIFDAVIIRDVPADVRNLNGSIDLQALGEAGFRYLNYDVNPLRPQGEIVLDGGSVSKVYVSALAWVGQTARDVGEVVRGEDSLVGPAPEAYQRFGFVVTRQLERLACPWGGMLAAPPHGRAPFRLCFCSVSPSTPRRRAPTVIARLMCFSVAPRQAGLGRLGGRSQPGDSGLRASG